MKRTTLSRAWLFIILTVISFYANADQLIVEPDMGRTPIINLLNQSKTSIQLAMYGFTDSPLLKALIQQQLAHKSLNVLLEAAPYQATDENVRTMRLLNVHHIPLQGHLPGIQLIHEKALIIDRQTALIMTFNFTASSFSRERNFGLLLNNDARTQAIEAIFAADWNHQPVKISSSAIALSPINSRQQLLTLINSAQHHLQVYAQDVSDYRIIGALAQAARRGVQVQLLTSDNIRAGKKRYLEKAGVTIHDSHSLIIHAKVFIVDDEAALLGSINLTTPSLDNNRELSVITRDSNVIRTLTATFAHDWQS